MTRLPLALWIGFSLISATASAEITAEQRTELASVQKLVKQAGALYVEGKYDDSAQAVASALVTAKKLIATKDQDVLDALEPDYGRMKKAYELLRAKGVTLPSSSAAAADQPSKSQPEQPAITGVSFTKEVVPILMSKCGKCHIQDAKGKYSAKDFVSLVKGSRKGKAVIAGKPDTSRLIMLIKTGKMPPRSRGFPPAELKTLTDWIEQGAKFDGHDEKADLRSLKMATDE